MKALWWAYALAVALVDLAALVALLVVAIVWQAISEIVRMRRDEP